MLELIDKEAAYIALKREAEAHMLPESHEAYIRAARIIDQMKPIEAEPVRHGRWIEESANEYYCSYCGKYAPIAKNMRHCDCSKWCKECGTKMDGGADNG